MGAVAAAVADRGGTSRYGAGLFHRARVLSTNIAAISQDPPGCSRRRRDLHSHGWGAAPVYRQPGRLDEHALPAARTGRNDGADTGAVRSAYARDVFCLCGNGSTDPRKRLCGADPKDRSATMDVCAPYDRLSDRFCIDPGYPAGVRRGNFHLGFCVKPGLRQRGAVSLDAGERRLGGQASEKGEANGYG